VSKTFFPCYARSSPRFRYLFDCDGWHISNPPMGLQVFDPRLAEIAKAAARRADFARAEAAESGYTDYVYSAYSGKYASLLFL
jgi:hypothetical protein